MKTRMLLCSLALVGLTVSACEREPRTAREELAATATEDPGYRTEEPAPVIPVPDTADSRTAMGNLMEMHNSGARGTVTVRAENARTEVLLSVIGVTPNTSIVPTIHRGRCDEAGQLVEQMQPVPVPAEAIANATLHAGVAFHAILDGGHSVRVYPEVGPAAPPLACADLPQPAESSPL